MKGYSHLKLFVQKKEIKEQTIFLTNLDTLWHSLFWDFSIDLFIKEKHNNNNKKLRNWSLRKQNNKNKRRKKKLTWVIIFIFESMKMTKLINVKWIPNCTHTHKYIHKGSYCVDRLVYYIRIKRINRSSIFISAFFFIYAWCLYCNENEKTSQSK